MQPLQCDVGAEMSGSFIDQRRDGRPAHNTLQIVSCHGDCVLSDIMECNSKTEPDGLSRENLQKSCWPSEADWPQRRASVKNAK